LDLQDLRVILAQKVTREQWGLVMMVLKETGVRPDLPDHQVTLEKDSLLVEKAL
jgi:hypothetical protein